MVFIVKKIDNMIRKLFSKGLLFASVVIAATTVGKAQTTTIATTTPSAAAYYITGDGDPTTHLVNFITFDILNDNLCPTKLTSVSSYHAGSRVGNGVVRSQNNALYELWVSTTKISGPPTPITGANGWTKIATTTNINTGTTNGVTEIFKNVSYDIPPQTKVRFLIYCAASMFTPANTNPGTITVNNITLFCGSNNENWAGFFFGNPAGFNYPNNGSFSANVIGAPITTINFEGAVKLETLPPDVTADISLKPKVACIGDDVLLKATSTSPGATYTWRNQAGTVLVSNSPTGQHLLTNVQPSDAGKYYVTSFACGAESFPDSATLNINDPIAPTYSGKTAYCLNEQFEPITINGTNPKWYYDAVGGSPVPVTPTINTSSPNSLTYYISQTDAFGCESRERTQITFTAAAKPAVPIVSTPVYYCENATADELTAIGQNILWYYFPTGGIETSIPPTPNTTALDSFQYYVTQTVDGCESDRNRIDVVVTQRPNGMILLDKDDICAEDSITIGYYGSAFPTAQYNWTLPTPGAVVLNGGFDQGPITVRLDSAGQHQVKLRVGVTGCLSDQYVEDVRVRALPYGRIVAKQDVCLQQPELIEATGYTEDLDSFAWDFDGGLTTHFTTEQGPYGVYWNTDGEKIVKVTFTHEGCSDFAVDTVTVRPKPSAKIVATWENFDASTRQFATTNYNFEADSICSRDSLKVSVEVVEPGATYKWTPTRFFDTYSDIPSTYARIDFDSKIFVEVEDIYGCRNIDSAEVDTKRCCEMTFPNAFTPNGDGLNDFFRPITVGRREVETFRVVNRYGQTVYESIQSSRGWDGNMNGKPADVGTYFYLISFMCGDEKVDQGGEVILIR